MLYDIRRSEGRALPRRAARQYNKRSQMIGLRLEIGPGQVRFEVMGAEDSRLCYFYIFVEESNDFSQSMQYFTILHQNLEGRQA